MKQDNLDNFNIEFNSEKSDDSNVNSVLPLRPSIDFRNSSTFAFSKKYDSVAIKKISSAEDLGKAMSNLQDDGDYFDDLDEENITFSTLTSKNTTDISTDSISFKSNPAIRKHNNSSVQFDFEKNSDFQKTTDSPAMYPHDFKHSEKNYHIHPSSQNMKLSFANDYSRKHQLFTANSSEKKTQNDLEIEETTTKKHQILENTKHKNSFSDEFCEVKFYDFRKLAIETKEKKLQLKKKKQKKLIRNILVSISIFVFIFMFVININIFVQRKNNVYGSSMEPTLQQGDTIYSTMLPYIFGDPEIGDIVIIDISLEDDFKYFHLVGQVLKRNDLTQLFFDDDSKDMDKCWVKRIVGVAGDTLKFEDGKFYRNGQLVVEDYIKEQNVHSYPKDTTITIPKGYVYVMGDNRNISKDSRDASVGPIPVYQIIGKMRKSE